MGRHSTITLGEKITLYRRRAGLNQEQLGKLTGVSKGTVSNYETNKTAPDIRTLTEIAIVLDVPLRVLLPGPRDPGQSFPPLGRRLALYPENFFLDETGRITENPSYISAPGLESFTWDPERFCCVRQGAEILLFYNQTLAEKGDMVLGTLPGRNGPFFLIYFDGESYYEESSMKKLEQVPVIIAKKVMKIEDSLIQEG